MRDYNDTLGPGRRHRSEPHLQTDRKATYYKRDKGKWDKMTHCDQEGCLGHLSKFDNCMCEALYELSLSGMYDTVGTVEFEGVFTLVELPSDTSVHLLDGLDGPTVVLPAATYLMREDVLGHVAAYHYDIPVIARTEFEMAEAYFERWTDGEVDL